MKGIANCDTLLNPVIPMKKNNSALAIIPKEVLMRKIYLIRNEKVILDRDLAALYDVKAIRLREQVKRNI